MCKNAENHLSVPFGRILGGVKVLLAEMMLLEKYVGFMYTSSKILRIEIKVAEKAVFGAKNRPKVCVRTITSRKEDSAAALFGRILSGVGVLLDEMMLLKKYVE